MVHIGIRVNPIGRRTRPSSWRQLIALALAALAFGGAFLFGAGRQFSHVNVDMKTYDQAAYMKYAKLMRLSGYRFLGDRARMPVYPFVQSLFYRQSMSRAEHFAAGKRVNVAIALFGCAALLVIFRALVPLHPAINLFLISAFTVFVFKAAYVQCELLFYLLFFGCFLLMVRLLRAPRWPEAVALGVLLGITHLTKASVLPAVGLFVLFAAAKSVATAIRARREPGRLADAARVAGVAALSCAVYLAVISPYLVNSKRQYGRYFYNVTSTFYMWYDSWEEVRAGTKAHGDRLAWPTTPEALTPGPWKYLREHTLGQMGGRLAGGARLVTLSLANSYGYLKYVVIFLAAAGALAALHWRQVKAQLARDAWPAAFCASFFIGYLLLYWWYAPIAFGERLTLALFLPLMFGLTWAIQRLPATPLPLYRGGRALDVRVAFDWAISALVAVDVLLILGWRIATTFAAA